VGRLDVHLTGGLCLAAGDEVVPASAFPGRQGRIAFAYLVWNPRPVTRDELAEVIWGDRLSKSWERDLSAVVSKLRPLLRRVGLDPAQALVSAVGCYELRLPGDAYVDVKFAVNQLEDAAVALRLDDLQRAHGAANIASNLLDRPFLPGDEGPWIDDRRAERRRMLVQAREILVDVVIGRDLTDDALLFAQKLLEVDPYHEVGYARLMRLHLVAGKRVEALRLYERCRTLLRDDLGISPSPEVEAAYREALGEEERAPVTATPSGGIVTLLFTDLVASTELLDRLGSDAAEQLRRVHFSMLRDAVAARGGQEVKNMGDGLMVAFGSALDAVGCAVDIQRAVQSHNERGDGPALDVRIGLNVGEPIRDEGDYFGAAVVVAKRLCDSAGAGQILASDLVRGLTADRAGDIFGPRHAVTLKGFREPVTACDVSWEPAETGHPTDAA
jgi:class 3 adenylate cyclase